MIHRHKVPGPASRRKSEFFPQLGLYILRSRLEWPFGGRARNGGSTNKIDRLGHFSRNLVIAWPTLPASAKVGPFLKHVVHRRFFLASTAAAYDTLHKMFGRLPIVWCSARVSLLISDWPYDQKRFQQYFRGHGGSDEDSLVPKNQHAGVIRFRAGFKAFRDLLVIQNGLHQRFQTMRFRIVEELRSGPLLFRHWKGDGCKRQAKSQ